MAPDSVAGRALPSQAPLVLEVNGVNRGQVIALVEADTIWIPVEALIAAGATNFAGERQVIDDKEYVALASLRPDVDYALDERTITLRVSVGPRYLATTQIDLRRAAPPGITRRRDPAAFFNYSVTAADAQRPVIVGEAGVSLGGALFNASAARSQGVWTRGPASLTVDDTTRLRRYVVGDTIASTGLLGPALPLVGVSAGRAFDIDPYFAPLPGLDFSGVAGTPSTVEVYVNQQLVRRERVVSGPFALRGITPPVGQGDTRIIVRDAFGGERVVDRAYYQAASALPAGVHEFQYAAGLRREAGAMWRYDRPMFSAWHRVGLNDWLTPGVRLVGTTDTISGGPSAAVRTSAGEIEGAAGISRGPEGTGAAGALAYTFQMAQFNLGGFARIRSRAYADGDAPISVLRERSQASLFMGVAVGPRTSVTARHDIRQHWNGASEHRTTVTGMVRLASRAMLLLTLGQNQLGSETTRSAFVGLSLFAGRQTTATVGYEARSDGAGFPSLSVLRSTPLGPGYGVRLQAQGEEFDQGSGAITWQDRLGRVEVGYDQFDGQARPTATVAGALVYAAGRPHLTRPVHDAFGLVRLSGFAGVRTYLSNQYVGRTDGHGEIVLPELGSYYANDVRIDEADLPIDAVVRRSAVLLAPALRGGAVADFPVRLITRVTGRVVIEDEQGGRRPGRYGDLTIPGTALSSPLGRNGEFYFEGLDSGLHDAELRLEAIRYRCRLDVPAIRDPQIDLGTVTCRRAEESNR